MEVLIHHHWRAERIHNLSRPTAWAPRLRLYGNRWRRCDGRILMRDPLGRTLRARKLHEPARAELHGLDWLRTEHIIDRQ